MSNFNTLNTPHELKTIEIDTEKKIFRVNGEDFGKGCSGFTISCEGPGEFEIWLSVDTTVHYAHYSRFTKDCEKMRKKRE